MIKAVQSLAAAASLGPGCVVFLRLIHPLETSGNSSRRPLGELAFLDLERRLTDGMRGEKGCEGGGLQQDWAGLSRRTGEGLHKTRSSVHLKLQLSWRLLQINAAAAPRVTARGSRRK